MTSVIRPRCYFEYQTGIRKQQKTHSYLHRWIKFDTNHAVKDCGVSVSLCTQRLKSKGSPKTLPMYKENASGPRHLSHDRSPETGHSQVTHLRLFSMKNRACGAKTPLFSVSSPLTSAAPTMSILLGSALRLFLR